MNIALQIIPLLYILASIAAVIYVFTLLVRFVRAHERAAAALEELARKNR